VSYRSLSVVMTIAFVFAVAGTTLTQRAVAQDEEKSAQAQKEQADPAEVVARVDGTPITRAQLKLAKDELGQDLARLPKAAQRQLILQYVVELNLLADAARKAKLHETDKFKTLSKYYEMRALRDIFFQREVQDNITDEAAQKLYDERIGSSEPVPEIRARHILVETEEKANALAKKISDGADFAELAKEESTGPSSAKGGDLGFFAKDQMVEPFAEAAFKLEKGEVSDPVKTRFGWHLIKVEDKRDRQPPKFSEVKDRLKSSMVRQQLQKRMAELREAASIEVLDESLKPKAADTQEKSAEETKDSSTTE